MEEKIDLGESCEGGMSVDNKKENHSQTTIQVRFGSNNLFNKHTLPLKGAGELRICGDTIELCPISLKKYEVLNFQLNQIADVIADNNKIQFSVYSSEKLSGNPLYVCLLSTKRKEEAQRVISALPDTVSENAKQEIEEHISFLKILLDVTPSVFFTPAIITINVLVFLLMSIFGAGFFEPSVGSLISWGADYGPLTLTGEWWRMLTCVFVHIGIIHLLFNMWVLSDIGVLVERVYGNLPFIIIYLSTGIISSMTSLHFSPDIVSAGASGAIFGLYGALIGFFLREKTAIPMAVLRKLRSSSLTFIGYNLFYGFIHPNIDNGAHVGGLVCGIALGFIAARPFDLQVRKEQYRKCLQFTMGAFAIPAIIFFIMLSGESERKLEQESCTLVNQVLQENFTDSAKCLAVKFGKEFHKNHYHAKAVLDNGNNLDITVKYDEEQIEVSIPAL